MHFCVYWTTKPFGKRSEAGLYCWLSVFKHRLERMSKAVFGTTYLMAPLCLE